MRRGQLPERAASPIFLLYKEKKQRQETNMGLFQNLRKALRPRTNQEIELEYLNGSTSAVDLEMRMREIDRGKFRRYSRLG